MFRLSTNGILICDKAGLERDGVITVEIKQNKVTRLNNAIKHIKTLKLGIVHILRNHQGGGGFGMIRLMLFLLYPMSNLITEGGRGLETDKSDYVI